ncbi:FAD/NAD(P)-binding domain-containing protein [Xylaria acuta]|nr:FAD/NAD(P)-binding domain-containing protein [Xylaria acuta]
MRIARDHLQERTNGRSHVLIVGAGLGSLGLAQGLKKHGTNFAVFERDSTPDARAQGYRIKVFPDTVPDLQYLMRSDLFVEFEATTAETIMVETSVNVIDGRLIARRALRGPKPYTVDRGFLRKVLLRGLQDHIQRGKEATHYEIDKNNSSSPTTAHFPDGSTASGALLIGADGGHSPIRRQHVPRHRIIDPEAVCIYGRTMLTQDLEKRIQPRLLKGLAIIIFNSELPISMFVERMHFPHHGPDHPDLPEDYMYWSMLAASKLVGFTDEMLAAALGSRTPKDLGLVLTEEWDDSTRCLLELQDETYGVALRVTSSTPDLSEWQPSPFVTLVGDATHAMFPSGGVGAATALKDAVALTKALVGPNGLSLAGIKEYEATIKSAAKVAIERSFRGGKLLYCQPSLELCRVLSDA